MSLRKFIHSETFVVAPTATVIEAAALMKQKNVGSVIVVDKSRPIGILTDRDIVLRVVAEDFDAAQIEVGQVMTENLTTLPEDIGLYQALELVKGQGIRRFPVIDSEGELCGIFTLDDILFLLGKELADVTSIIQEERLPRFF